MDAIKEYHINFGFLNIYASSINATEMVTNVLEIPYPLPNPKKSSQYGFIKRMAAGRKK